MGSSSKWRKVKIALGLNLNLSQCTYLPKTSDDDSHVVTTGDRSSDAAPPSSSSRRLKFSRSRSSSSKQTCSICLNKMKQGEGQAIFTAECSHSFHFHCVALNVEFGNQVCPICRAKWKDVPSRGPCPIGRPRQDDFSSMVARRHGAHRQNVVSLFQSPEPSVFNDDELLDQPTSVKNLSCNSANGGRSSSTVQIKSYPEVTVIPQAISCDDFSFLIHVKAAETEGQTISGSYRAPVDLVTVLDISGSMAGMKLVLLKRAMGFVIQNLSSSDRLSVIAFSSTARRLFPLRRMSDAGRQEALRAVNSLVANGGTNIAEGLGKGARVISERKQKNPVASIILLSDGQDTHAVPPPSIDNQRRHVTNNHLSTPPMILRNDAMGLQLPVHTFGFGIDHDALAMHSISEISGGTFSFIESEAVIQDAFAQCIGGLLSVVAQEIQVRIECVHPSMQLVALRAGSYPSRVLSGRRAGIIDIGDLYADEERDFLISVNIPPATSFKHETSLPRVECVYKDPLTMESVIISSEEVSISRPEVACKEVSVSLEVDRQRNRLRAAEAMSQARALAERGDLNTATSILENCRRLLSESASAKSRDRLCIALDAEMKEMQERMASRHAYETSGRAYILSGLSSHSWQRATARGDSTERYSLVQAYQTPSMTELITQSQATLSGSRPSAAQQSRTLRFRTKTR